jgi:hypothetical protein
MSPFYKLLFLTLFLPLFSLAQNYQPGVVVNLKGDTMHGFINYGEWENSPQNISFKHELAGAPVKLTVNDIKYFSISVGHLAEYERYEGPVSTDITEINHLSVGRDSSFKTDTVFLKVLQKGKNLMIFSYSDDTKIRYFISANSVEKPVELIFRIYYNSEYGNGQNRTSYENIYKSQLYDAAKKSNVMTEALKNQIKNAAYTQDDILKISSIINGISTTNPLNNNPSKPRPFNKALAIIGIVVVIVGVITEFVALNSH